MRNQISLLQRVTVGICFAVVALFSVTLPGCGGRSSTSSNSLALSGLAITPQNSSITLGQNLNFKVIAVFSNGSSQDETSSVTWTSSNQSVASVDATGLATSLTVGSSLITANFEGTSASANLTVSPAAIASISINPTSASLALGVTEQLKATGTYTDQSTRDITNVVSWQSSNAKIATVTSSGLAGSESVGQTSIVATSGSVTASCQLTVLPAALTSIAVIQDNSTVPLGTTLQLKAEGQYTDGEVIDLTNSVSWSSSPQGIVSIAPSGLASGRAIGTATVVAGSGSITGAGNVKVVAPLLTSIQVSSTSVSMPLGTSQQLTATGSYTDGSTQDLTSAVRWASASNGVVDVSDGGEAVAKSMGTSLVSAISGGIEGKELLSVTPAALVTITVSPSGPTLLVGDNLQLKATGTFTDASTQDLTKTATWSLDNNTVASINGGGDVWAAQVGVATAEATLAQVQGSTTVLVHPVAAVNYFHVEPYGADTTFRLTDPGGDLPALCAMLYVFDQDQQMAECCGCRIGRDGLRTLSLNKDLVSNPLTDRAPVSGSIFLITAAYAGNSSCDASSITPNGMAVAWATHLQAAATPNVATTEETLSRVPLSDTLSSAIQTQCSFVQQLGGGHGICSCGDGH